MWTIPEHQNSIICDIISAKTAFIRKNKPSENIV